MQMDLWRGLSLRVLNERYPKQRTLYLIDLARVRLIRHSSERGISASFGLKCMGRGVSGARKGSDATLRDAILEQSRRTVCLFWIERTSDRLTALSKHVRVDHGRAHVGVPE